MLNFGIGDAVTVKKTGERGKVIEIFESSRKDSRMLYNVQFGDGTEFFYEDEIEKYVHPKKEYSVKVEVLDDVVVSVLYEVDKDGLHEIARGHGHIIHEGETGIAQALSYSGRRILARVDTDGVCFKKGGALNGA